MTLDGDTNKHVIGNTIHSADVLRMMHFIVSKEQITYLKTLFSYMMKVYNPHYICAHT